VPLLEHVEDGAVAQGREGRCGEALRAGDAEPQDPLADGTGQVVQLVMHVSSLDVFGRCELILDRPI
jgi:hypothetical protein